VVADYPAMSQQIGRMVERARSGAGEYPFDEVNETMAFLRWLLEGNFTFLGYREYEADEGVLRVLPGSGLGLLGDTEQSTLGEGKPISALHPSVQARIDHGDLLVVTKTNRFSPVHRRARMDYVGVRSELERSGGEPDGRHRGKVGECRLIGLFTTKAYSAPASETPLLHHKLQRILEAEDLIDGSHDHRAAEAIFGSFPKDELFAAGWQDLRAMVVALLAMQSDEVRVLARRSHDDRTAAVVVALPRRRYAAPLVERVQRLLQSRFPDATIESHIVVDEQFTHARLHYTVHSPAADLPEPDLDELETEVARVTRSWDDAVEAVLRERHGRLAASGLAASWRTRFPDFYKAATLPELAAADIERLEELESGDADLVVGLQHAEGRSGPRTRLALYKRGGKVPLSEILPTLEMLGLRVHDERPTRLTGGDEQTFVQNFGVLGPDGVPLDLDALGDRLAATILAVRNGQTDADWLSRLVLVAGLTWQQVGMLRAYRVYRQRAGARFGLKYDGEAFASQPHIAVKLVRYFELRHSPDSVEDGEAADALREEILADLDAVESLDQDRILRDQLTLVDATLRTNAFRAGRDAMAIKLRSADVPGIPSPKPHVEVFVHSVAMEGIHLRGGAIARGGLRWSDRLDFRTEVYGLMRAQMTKNAVIVPTGAKGGFYLRRRPEDPAALREEVARQYQRYIRALLDITDNLVEGKVAHPDGVRVLDGDDPYLVVAADKGTATFSDTANAIAAEYGFWLGDAFASGGSEGYDHKGLGITARGAWESVRRHFRELGVDPERDEISAVGIGDMSGDVFGNGLLLSRTVRLVAAYDHRHVFIDPSPDPGTSWRERKRLFDQPRSSWADYDRGLISEGGGVWPRKAKSVPLSPAARAALGIEADHLTPDELIRAILRAPVDLLFNGGIGTVVKASTESDADARDRASDGIRVDASDLRCRVVGEGGNLGFTQRGRIEFSAAGGNINADFIDNSAGVDCSDHEVNVKILLDLAVARRELDAAGRHTLLRAMTDDVVAHVLQDSYRQARILSRELTVSGVRLYAYEDLMTALEEEGILDRDADALPNSIQLGQRRRASQGLHRPELAVLLAHAKRSLTDALMPTDLVEDPWLGRELRGYFPRAAAERFPDLIGKHRLRRELVATLIANEVVDAMGPSFVSRLATELGTAASDVVRAYRIARDVTGAVGRLAAIDALDAGLDRDVEVELVDGVE
ncbi:MAG: glutamate dehydrogenase, partial [Solirubrobacteraceae bacterium]|nr:glutamate dehydrogenase [Solirubrobacteraceae bacterium]